MATSPAICQTCLCNSTLPGITINQTGTCSECLNARIPPQIEPERFRLTLDRHFYKLKQANIPYHVMVMFSGGKDSSYLLYLVKKHYGLRPLAFAVIHPFVNELARQNMERAANALQVDLIKFYLDEQVMKTYMRYGIIHAERYGLRQFFGCALCSSMYHLISLKMAIQMKIPYLLSGNSPNERPFPEFITGKTLAKHVHGASQHSLRNLVDDALGEAYRGSMYDFRFEQFPEEAFPYKVAPFSFLEYDYQRIVRELADAGVLEATQTDTGETNCDVMHLFEYIAYKRYDCHPYITSFAQGIRQQIPTLADEFFRTGAHHLNREDHLSILAELKHGLFYIAEHPEITSMDRRVQQSLFPFTTTRIGEEKLTVFVTRLLTIHAYAKYFDLDLHTFTEKGGAS
jgi:hypothetical protein